MIHSAGDFRIEARWKEEVAYWEGPHGYVFDAAWGKEPRNLYVPEAEDWSERTPRWMWGRRDDIVDRLTKFSQHNIVEEAASADEPTAWQFLAE